MSNYSLVLNHNKQPLDPIHPGTARRLLKARKAAVYRLYPFTIIYKQEVNQTPTPNVLKLDPGSKTTGIALIQNDKVIWAAELTHRGRNIQASLESRSAIRGNRRARKTRYRPARFLNRTRSKGWLAPSLQHRVDTTLTWVNKLVKLTPIGSIVQELVRFDLQQLENPEISGIEYQQGELLGYEVREYLLNKWDRKCTYCEVKDVPLQVEHVKPKASGGTNRVSNLCLACEKCNQKKGTLDIKVFLAKKPELLRKIQSQLKAPLKDAAAVNSTRWALFNRLKLTGLPVSTGSGGLTKFNRTRLDLPKTHWLDAACVGVVDTLMILTNQPLLIKSQGHGTRQMCGTDKYGFPTRHRTNQKVHFGFQTGDLVRAVVTTGKFIGTWIGRISVRARPSFKLTAKQTFDVHPKNLTTIHKNDGYSYAF
jgi:5-methylcytosine-specific restriction endonuclease McrA